MLMQKLTRFFATETILDHVDTSIWILLFTPFVLPLVCYVYYIYTSIQVKCNEQTNEMINDFQDSTRLRLIRRRSRLRRRFVHTKSISGEFYINPFAQIDTPTGRSTSYNFAMQNQIYGAQEIDVNY